VTIPNKYLARDNRELRVAFFDGLYAKLCQYFTSTVCAERVPSKHAMSATLSAFGGFAMEENEDAMVIDRCNFLAFWRWFRGCCAVMSDLAALWDAFELDLLVSRRECEERLRASREGTFLLRLSRTRQSALVISYISSAKVKHILLTRQSKDSYVTKTNANDGFAHRTTSIPQLIRAFVKLQFVYTPQCVYKKSHVF